MATTEEIIIDVKTQGAEKTEKSLDDVADATNEADESAEKYEKTLGDLGKEATLFGVSINGISSAFKNSIGAVRNSVKSLGTFKVALAATGIGLAVIALTSLSLFFTKTERGAQALRVGLGFLEGAMGAITDVAISIGETLFNAFISPKVALDNLWDTIKTYFTDFIPNAIQKVLDGFGLLGTAIQQLVDGEWSQAMDTALLGVESLVDGVTDIIPVTAIFKAVLPSVIDFGKEILNDANAMASLVDQTNKLTVAERNQSVRRAQGNAILAEQVRISKDITENIEDRIFSAERALEIEKTLAEEELKNARARVKNIQDTNALAESGEADLQALADAQIALFSLQESSTTKQIRLQTELNNLNKQAIPIEEEKTETVEASSDALTAQKAIARSTTRENAGATVELIDSVRDATNEGSKAFKALSIASAIINVQLAITRAFATGLTLAERIAAVAVAVTAGVSAINTIRATAIPTARDGILVGPGHNQGGVLINAEGGEAVINKRSVAMYREQLSAINEAGGGIPFMQRGGLVAPQTISPFTNLENALNASRPVLVLQDLDQAISEVNAIEVATTL